MSSYKVILAEKYSVAAEIAKIAGATAINMSGPCGYMEGNGYVVTWAMGHMVGLETPEQMGFGQDELPVIPEQWRLRLREVRGKNGKKTADQVCARQMEIIRRCFADADEIIVATDAGREGELIFRYIYEYLGCNLPFRRLWISSLTDEAIRKGLAGLRPGHDYDRLADAARARSRADWLVGMNASRALRLTVCANRVMSLGRVQTPTLGMICRRYETYRDFVPQPFWRIKVNTRKGLTEFNMMSEERFTVPEIAGNAYWKVRSDGTLVVTDYRKKSSCEYPPLLYDLTALQRDANTKFGLTAQQTLEAAQSLYEKKLLSYPRTGSRYISADVFGTVPSLLGKLSPDPVIGKIARNLSVMKLPTWCVDDAKVTDHHALLPLGGYVTKDLTETEAKIYRLVCIRLCESFGETAQNDVSEIYATCGGIVFRARGSRTRYPGWKGVRDAVRKAGEGEGDAEKDVPRGEDLPDENQLLPEVRPGEVLRLTGVSREEGKTRALPPHTDSSLLGMMETCGKDIDDEDAREAMKECGIGTQATRAAIIEDLIRRGYAERKNRSLLPTELGMQIWKAVSPFKIADVKLTGEWEYALVRIERGEMDAQEFQKSIHTFTGEVVREITEATGNIKITTDEKETFTCPFCGEEMKDLRYNVVCGCGFSVPKELLGKKLSERTVRILSRGETTPAIQGFVSKKTGKQFKARLTVDKATRKVVFKFDD